MVLLDFEPVKRSVGNKVIPTQLVPNGNAALGLSMEETMTESLSREMVDNFDLDDPEFPNRFDEISSEMLSKCPVAHSPALGGYKVVFTDAEIRDVAQNWQLFSNRFGYEPNRASDDNARLYPLELDPPYQSRWRSTIGQ